MSHSLECECPAPLVAKNISIVTTTKTEIIAIRPGIAGYTLFQNLGRHGSVIDTKAVGRRCTNAVARRTPVPKCLERKRKRCGIGRPGKRRAIIGKEHAKSSQPPEALVANSALT